MRQQFDLLGPLPEGTTLLEASAGTGKTYTLAALATRFVAEDKARIDQLMMVTFTRAATAELRSRIYERLQGSLEAILAFADESRPADDPLDALLCTGSPAELSARASRLEAALGDIDRAVIATTHEFCARMLTELGILVDHDNTTRFVDDITDLICQAVDDTYLRWFIDKSSPPSLASAMKLGITAVSYPDIPIFPAGQESGQAAFAEEIRARVSKRKRELGVYSFNDMVSRLIDTLTHPVTGISAQQVLSSRFPLVLVDEFQDTDSQQWQILQTAFHGRSTLVLIGDPKQSIYAFRGADINSYLSAAEHADQIATLSVNHRSDACVIRGIHQLFGEASVGVSTSPILVHETRAHHDDSRLIFPPEEPNQGVQLRVIDLDSATRVDIARQNVNADVVASIAHLIDGSFLLRRSDTITTPVRASDIAVIVRTNRRAEAVQHELVTAGIPAVLSGASSVFTSQAADEWQLFLDALANPHPGSLSVAAMTSLVGWSSRDLAALVGEKRSTLNSQIRDLAQLYVQVGIAGVFEKLCSDTDLYARLLSRPGGDRLVTDLRHIEQVLNKVQTQSKLSLVALSQWLRQRREEVAAGRGTDRTRRLETDLAAVQVMTIHRAKGLQFPVVLLPDASDVMFADDQGDPLIMHWEGQRILDVGGDEGRSERFTHSQNETLAESLREFYVAATRAQSLLVAWWVPTRLNTHSSPLHRLIFNDSLPAQPPNARYLFNQNHPPELPVVGPDVHISRVRVVPCRPLESPHDVLPPLIARRFTRQVDHDWNRTSYSGLTRSAHETSLLPLDTEEETELKVDDTGELLRFADDAITPLTTMAGGAQFGSVVHSVLEKINPTSEQLREELCELCAHALSRLPVPQVDPEVLGNALYVVMQTPLGALTSGLALCQIPAQDRLTELTFELPLGSYDGRERSTVAQLAALFQDRSLIESNDPLIGYGDYLSSSSAADQVLAGFLTGSIDAVFRVNGRFIVVDYKTNRLPTRIGEPLRFTDYTSNAMATAMIEAHYPLQALLYAVALHRYLGWRLPDYTPHVHLGGVGYLFIRGMNGPVPIETTDMPFGVFTWHPSVALIECASQILAGGRL